MVEVTKGRAAEVDRNRRPTRMAGQEAQQVVAHLEDHEQPDWYRQKHEQQDNAGRIMQGTNDQDSSYRAGSANAEKLLANPCPVGQNEGHTAENRGNQVDR